LTPRNLAITLRSLPAILYMLDPISVAGCSKAPRGLSVLLRVTCIFTGTSVSPSTWPRQRPSRYAIRAGRNLPDKEFRSVPYLALARRRWFSSHLPACRHADGTISSPDRSGVWRMASEDSHRRDEPFLLIVRTRRIVTGPVEPVARDTRRFQQIARFY